MPVYSNITFSEGIISMESSLFFTISEQLLTKIIFQIMEWIQKVNLMKIKMVEDCFYSVSVTGIAPGLRSQDHNALCDILNKNDSVMAPTLSSTRKVVLFYTHLYYLDLRGFTCGQL